MRAFGLQVGPRAMALTRTLHTPLVVPAGPATGTPAATSGRPDFDWNVMRQVAVPGVWATRARPEYRATPFCAAVAPWFHADAHFAFDGGPESASAGVTARTNIEALATSKPIPLVRKATLCIVRVKQPPGNRSGYTMPYLARAGIETPRASGSRLDSQPAIGQPEPRWADAGTRSDAREWQYRVAGMVRVEMAACSQPAFK
jgi:hypothetical protein